MYIVSFYSYRGGVGRTMALANTALELAKRGRKVLIVDFDLEAPGISTFGFCNSHSDAKGVVDYVCEYKNTGQAPKIEEYLHRCEIPTVDSKVEFWMMPAGRQDEHYAEKFQSINWEQLYSEQSGFLLIENLKEQWNDSLRPDYVFIDSRTGHTDISGICTRQLPDAAAFIFFPNLQNLSGLTQVVNEARSEAVGERKKPIHMHFVASNIPDIDDEAGILRDHLNKFKAALGYTHLNFIRYYNSLSIMNQDIFTLIKPKTKLAIEYVKLANNIIKENPADRDGAIAYAVEVREKIQKDRRRHFDRAAIKERLAKIQKLHPIDGAVHAKLADLYFQIGDFLQATAEYEEAIKHGQETVENLFMLAFLYSNKGRKQEAASCLLKLIANPSTNFEVPMIIEQLVTVDPTAIPEALQSEGVKKLHAEERLKLSRTLRSQRELIPFAIDFLRMIQGDDTAESKIRDSAGYDLILCKVALGKYSEALADLGSRKEILESDAIGNVFNCAMIEWAETKKPPLDLFARVIELSEDREDFDANFAQCLAIANYLVQDRTAAFDWLYRANQRVSQQHNRNFEFSCWSYLYVTLPQFISDLENIRHMFAGEPILPAFMTSENGAPH